MKKIILILGVIVTTLMATAQNKSIGSSTKSIHKANQRIKVLPMPENRATGDSLLWFPAPDAYVTNPADYPLFEVVTEDIDGLLVNGVGYSPDYSLYYTDDNSMAGATPTQDNYYFPWENPVLSGGTDSAFFWGATSWFNPPGIADNWLIMGPITIPATGAYLGWHDRTNPEWRDGYKVFISSTVSSTMTFSDFTGAPIYIKTDAYPSPTEITDTTWMWRTANIPTSFNGQQIYIAFNHTANDMDELYLDNFTKVLPIQVQNI